jgi:hypothetical protein
LGLGGNGRADEVAFPAVPDHLGAGDTAKGTEGGEQVNGFEDVGLALRVVPQEQVEAGRKIGVQPRVIAEVAEPQMNQMHNTASLGDGAESSKTFAAPSVRQAHLTSVELSFRLKGILEK